MLQTDPTATCRADVRTLATWRAERGTEVPFVATSGTRGRQRHSRRMSPTFRRATTFLLLVSLTATLARNAAAQNPVTTIADLPPVTLALSDLTELRAASGNWKLVGRAETDRPQSSTLITSPGTGTLVNTAPGASLSTRWEHGDLDLSFDVMLPKGSATAVILMGRYGLQLSDSWSSGAPTLAATGAVAPRWDSARGRGRESYEGTPPRQDAARAPGLWQHVDIVFRAPRFADGRKVANARFARVNVNGVVVQENVQVTGPTRGAALQDERATGPLTFAGDQGAVAIRNILYKSYTGAVRLDALTYRIFEGDTKHASFAATHAASREGSATSISGDAAGVPDKFATTYSGTLIVPTTGRYRFIVGLAWIGTDSATRGPAIGGGTLSIDGRPVVVHDGADRRTTADVDLSAGGHPFSFTFYKNRAGFNRRDVTVSVEGPGVERLWLTDENGPAGIGGQSPANPIMVDAQAAPVILRSVLRHRNTKRVIAVSVADPLGVHYSYDLAQGALLYVWRGPFLETTQMWHERGEDQTAEPVGSTVTLPGTPSVARIANATAAWPDSLNERDFRRDGYQLDKSGHPTFLYHVRGVSVEDAIRPDRDGLSLHRELKLQAPPGGAETDGFHVQLAQAAHIARQQDGSYVVGDRTFYITLPNSSGRPILRRVNGMDELLLPVRFTRGASLVSYSIVW